MITPKMKDDVINILCSGTFNFGVHYNVPKTAFLEELADKDDPSKSFTENQLVSIFSQFERMGLISGYANNSRTVEFEVLVEANDFYIHGGFQAQEEILKANIEKLSQCFCRYIFSKKSICYFISYFWKRKCLNLVIERFGKGLI